MKHFFNLFLVLLAVGIFNSPAQGINNDSLKDSTQTIDNSSFKKILSKNTVPIGLIGLGVLINKSNFEKKLQTDIRNKVGNTYEYRIDDYFQYLPLIEMYTADVLGLKAKNHWFDQTKYLIISNVISSTITHTLKRTTKKTRPNEAPYSFPSGHTTFAFTNAAVLFQEFQESEPIFASSGYLFSTVTGAFRMVNNKHWMSDVLVGAGIGIIVTNLVYYFEPFKSFNPFNKVNNTTFSPQILEGTYGFYFAHQF